MRREPATLREVLEMRVATDADRLAFADADRRLTYGQLAAAAEDLARRLHGAGVGSGDRVALAMSAGVGWAEMFWAIQLLGAVPCAFNPSAPAETVRRRAQRIRPRLVLSDESAASLPRGRAPSPESRSTGEDMAILQPTSGTSGEPRTVMLRHRNVVTYLQGAGAALGITADDVLVCWVPPWHDLGLIRFIVAGVAFGAPCHIISPAIGTIPRWLATVSDVRATITGAPDFAYRIATRMVDPLGVDIRSLRLSTSGGEPVRGTTIEAFEQRFAVPGLVLPGYGLAEATLGVTTHRPGEGYAVDPRGNVSCGSPLPGVEVRIDTEAGEPGEILVRGATVFAGYLDAPEATRETLRDGWLRTGDIGYLDHEGRLFVLGRRRAMIKRGGAVIAPRELEEAAEGVAGVGIAAALGLRSDRAVTEEVTVVVEAQASDDRARQAIADEVAQAILRMSGFAPARVAVVPRRTIPRTHNGKVRHAALKTELLNGRIG